MIGVISFRISLPAISSLIMYADTNIRNYTFKYSMLLLSYLNWKEYCLVSPFTVLFSYIKFIVADLNKNKE